MKIRFAVFVDQFPELSETFIASELHELQRLGHRVHVESARHAPSPRAAAAEGLDVAYLVEDGRADRVRALLWLAARHPVRVVGDLVSRRRWRQEERVRRLRELAPAARRVALLRSDHVHAHFAAGAALDAMRVSRLLGVPYSVATHGYDIFQSPSNLVEKHERAAFAVSACDYSVSYLRERLPPATGERVHRLVVGVDGERFRRTRDHPRSRTVVAVARLIEKKGLPDLIAAAARLQRRGVEAQVRIVGDGPQREELRTLMHELGTDGSVELLGPRDPVEVHAILEAADLLVMPCVVAANGDRDTMPVVVKEALAMELPVVATDEVGLPEMVKPRWGRLVPPRSPDALADAIEEMLAMSPDTRAEMGRAGREFVLAECNLTRETERLVELVRSARG